MNFKLTYQAYGERSILIEWPQEINNNILKSILNFKEVLKKHYNKEVTLVFGCGGERDVKKRPLMTKVAKKLCKKIYVTDDNPRNESPKRIRKTI